MKTYINRSFVLLLVVMLCAACVSKSDINITNKEVDSVQITTMPESTEYSRGYKSKEKIEKITEYLKGLSLQTVLLEKPGEYNGLSYVITITYQDGSKDEFVHMGNQFLRRNDGPWMEMSYSQAEELEELINQMPSDA